MQQRQTNLVRLYLPLLTSSETEVRRQTWAILFAAYGERSLTYLRRLLSDSDIAVRQQADNALQAVSEITDINVQRQPFEGMYVECMGRLQVYIGNHRLQLQDWAQYDSGRVGSQKLQSVFAYLIHCGKRGTSRVALGDAICNGSLSAANFLRTISTLRRILEQFGGPTFSERALIVIRDQCILSPDMYDSDVQRFERAFSEADQCEHAQSLESAIPLYVQAFKLYGGPYMADILYGNGWSQTRRDMLMNSFTIAVERLAEHAYSNAEYYQCISLCEQVLDADQNIDDATAWMIRSYARLGLFPELEQAYQRYLHGTTLDPSSAEGQQDLVVQTYLEVSDRRGLQREVGRI